MRSLSLEELAVVLAHLQHFPAGDAGRVLVRLEVPERAFLEAAGTHPGKIAEDLAADRPESSNAFQSALERSSKDLAARKPELEQLEPLGGSRAKPRTVEGDVDSTLDALSARPAPPTPFRSGPPMAPPVATPRSTDDRGDTVGLEAAPSDALPFGTPDFSSWTVETHAAFTAERRWLDTDTVRKRYGIRDGADEHALIVHFNRRFARETGLRDRWAELVQRRMRELERGH